MQRIRIKVCGTTRLSDAEHAVACGVDALGFIFVPKSKRCISPAVAQSIITKLPPFVDRVGVFVNEPIQSVLDIVRDCDLSFVQLHGNEDAEYCTQLGDSLAGCKIIKAFRVGEHTVRDEFAAYAPVVQAYLLDTYVKGVEGGTGQLFDWGLVAALHLDKPVILAGGLAPDNIIESLQTMVPYAIDINSGVEDAPGLKNHEKLSSIVSKVRTFEQENMIL